VIVVSNFLKDVPHCVIQKPDKAKLSK
jgi:hypothetical protein